MHEISEYRELHPNSNLELRKEYWEIGKGLQKVDGLETSRHYDNISEETASGKYSSETACEKLENYYSALPDDSAELKYKEPDLSAARIALVLEQGGFKFSPSTLQSIHTELFHDLLPYKWVGDYRAVNIEKSEEILNGRSVEYANFRAISGTLKYDFSEESKARYSLPFTAAQVEAIATFTSNIWQTHPFREGNTRTIATFLILYLRNIGVDIDNEPFKIHADYFRNALVRSNYSNIGKGIQANSSYLKLFFENILQDAEHDLDNQDLRCIELFED
jgi:fido (protein-threonine AMPylation protein)